MSLLGVVVAPAHGQPQNGFCRNMSLHAGHLNINNLKMSKSLKNFISIRRGRPPTLAFLPVSLLTCVQTGVLETVSTPLANTEQKGLDPLQAPGVPPRMHARKDAGAGCTLDRQSRAAVTQTPEHTSAAACMRAGRRWRRSARACCASCLRWRPGSAP